MFYTMLALLPDKNGGTNNYAFFSQPPVITGSGSAKDVFTNVWVNKRVADGGDCDLQFSKEFYACKYRSPLTSWSALTPNPKRHRTAS